MKVKEVVAAIRVAVSEFTTMEGVEVYTAHDTDTGDFALHVVIPIREEDA